MGYWIVMAMVVIAIVAVLLALAGTAETPAADDEGRRPFWVAVGVSGTTADGEIVGAGTRWVELVRTTLPDEIITYDFTQAPATIARAIEEAVPVALPLEPEVVSVWLGVDDFLVGTELAVFERRLWEALAALEQVAGRLIVLDIPEVVALALAEDADDPATAVEDLRRWNATIARLAAACGATLVSLHDLQRAEHVSQLRGGEAGLILSEAGHRWLADRIRAEFERLLPERPVAAGAPTGDDGDGTAA